MTHPLPLRRPALPARMIPATSGEVTPHELQHGLALLHARERKRLFGAVLFNLRARKAVICVHVAGPHEQDIPKTYLGPLVLRYALQILSGNGARTECVVVVRGVVLEPPFMVIEQDPAADDPLFAPGAYAVHVAFLDVISAVDIVEGDAVVEFCFALVGEVAQAVPLGRALGVEGPDVVVYYAGWFLIAG